MTIIISGWFIFVIVILILLAMPAGGEQKTRNYYTED